MLQPVPALECVRREGSVCYPGEDAGGSGPGQAGNQGDWLWPVSHCQGGHLSRDTRKTKRYIHVAATSVCV